MEQVIEVRYAGTVVAKSAGIRDRDDGGLFLNVNEPMPVGTILTLTVDEAVKHGRVEQVVESTEAMQAGMRIRFVDGPVARPARTAAPPATPSAPSAPAAPAAPNPTAAPASAAIPDAIAEVTEDESAAIEGAVASTGPIETGGGDPNQGQGGGGGRRRRRRR